MVEKKPPVFDEQANQMKMQLVEIDKEYSDYMDQLRYADEFLLKHISARLKLLEEKQNKLGEEMRKRAMQSDATDHDLNVDALLDAWKSGGIEERKKISKKYIEKINIKDEGDIEIVWKVPGTSL